MRTYLHIFISSLLLIGIPSYGFIYRIDILHTWVPTLNDYQYIICLSDFHDKNHPQTQPQRTYIEQLLDQLATKNIYVLVEDLSSPNTITGMTGCGQFSIDSRGGILGGLSTLCKEKKIPVENVEYRFCRVAAFGPILNNIKQPLNTLEPANKITVDTINTEVQHAIERVRLFKGDPKMQKYYGQNIDAVLNEISKLHLNNEPQINIAHYLTKQTSSSTRLDKLKSLLTFDSGLLDLHFIHAILQARDKKIIIIVAGGAHISNICELLQKVGYTKIYDTPTTYSKEHNLNNCVGSRIIDENYCIKPEAVNLQQVEKFVVTPPKN